MTDSLPPLPLYGIWLPGRGWLRGVNKKPFADPNKAVAAELACRLGDGAKVYFIDPALVDLEGALLEAEAKQHIPLFARIHAWLKVR